MADENSRSEGVLWGQTAACASFLVGLSGGLNKLFPLVFRSVLVGGLLACSHGELSSMN